jgi:hypothetical protein
MMLFNEMSRIGHSTGGMPIRVARGWRKRAMGNVCLKVWGFLSK